MKNGIKLSNGVEIPIIGFGPGGCGYRANVYMSPPSMSLGARVWRKFVTRPFAKYIVNPRLTRQYVNAVAAAIKTGFRLIDYSAAYGSGRLIRDAIESSGLKRDEVFLTGRISNRAQFGGRGSVEKEIERILSEYETDYVDLLMFHWPVTGHYDETWRVICDAYKNRVAKSIGVANCHRRHLTVLEQCGLRPMINQFEVHPLFIQKELRDYCRDLGIVVESYSPIARFDDRLMRLPQLSAIARKYGKTPVQIVLRWHIENGMIPIIRSLNESRQRENFDIFDFSLSREELERIDGFNINSRLRYDPDNCDFTIL